MKFLLPVFICILLFSFGSSYAQADTSKAPVLVVKPKHSLVTGIAYTSPLHYFGRIDSLSSSAIIPTAVILFKNGLYLNGNLIFIQNKTDGINYAASTAGAGFRKYKAQGIGYSISVDKFFYKERSSIVQSSFDGQASAMLSWVDTAFNVHLGATSTFAENTDINAKATLERTIQWKTGKVNFRATPGFTANAGTQNFMRSYIKNTSGFPFPGTSEQVIESSRRFTLLSYEIAAPVVISYKKLIFSFTPAYVLPQNLVKVENRPDLSERGKNLFYVVAAALVKFDL